jgi:2-C-methyl-D-erythritol 2,4-cyclodiphosphate synthase
MYRIGFGTDVHRLTEGRSLIIGGVRVESDLGADGHSDADVLMHAATDAVLGARHSFFQ